MRKPPATAASLGHALRFEVEKTEYEMKLRVLSGDEPTEIILKKVKKTITEGPMGQKQLEFWVLEKCAISQFGTEAQKKIVAQVCSLMNESKIPYLQYSQRLAKFNPFLFEPYLKPSGYPSILTLKTNAG